MLCRNVAHVRNHVPSYQLAWLGLFGLCQSLNRGRLCGLCLLVGEHLLLDEHTVGLRGVLFLSAMCMLSS